MAMHRVQLVCLASPRDPVTGRAQARDANRVCTGRTCAFGVLRGHNERAAVSSIGALAPPLGLPPVV
jgi:hypothetical protein